MQYKTIVAAIRSEFDGKRVLGAIESLAQEHESLVIGVHAELSALAYVPAFGAEAVILDRNILDENRKRMADLEKWFRKACEDRSIPAQWRGFENYSGDSSSPAASVGIAADLVVVQQTDPDDPRDARDNPETLLFEAGRPMLMIPYTFEGALSLQHAVIAWKDSREAARAVFDSLPLLRMARKVEILTVDPEDQSEHSGLTTASDIAAALDRHGIHVSVTSIDSGDVPVASAIENHLFETGADLLVMGAYSSGPLTQRIFGGVTRTILGSMSTPTLLSR